MFKVYRRGACGGWAAVPMPAPRRPPFPQRLLPSPPTRLRQFGSRGKSTPAREPPTPESVGFLLAGRSGRFAVRGAKIRWKTPLPPCPAACPGAGGGSGQGAGCWRGAHLRHACGLRLWRGAADEPRSQPGVAGPGLTFGYRRAGLSGALGPCFSPELPSFTENAAFVYF